MKSVFGVLQFEIAIEDPGVPTTAPPDTLPPAASTPVATPAMIATVATVASKNRLRLTLMDSPFRLDDAALASVRESRDEEAGPDRPRPEAIHPPSLRTGGRGGGSSDGALLRAGTLPSPPRRRKRRGHIDEYLFSPASTRTGSRFSGSGRAHVAWGVNTHGGLYALLKSTITRPLASACRVYRYRPPP